MPEVVKSKEPVAKYRSPISKDQSAIKDALVHSSKKSNQLNSFLRQRLSQKSMNDIDVHIFEGRSGTKNNM